MELPSLFVLLLLVLAASTACAGKAWRFRRLALRGFDLPFVPTGPFRHAEPELRPLYGRIRDGSSVLNFVLHLLVAFGGSATLAAMMWAGVAAMDLSMRNGAIAGFQGAALGTLSALAMWLGHRKLHLIGGGVLTLSAFFMWPPAAPLLFILLVVQHDLMRRRITADEFEAKRVRSL